MGDEMQWVDFETAAPELAGKARGVIQRHGFVLLGTIRRDGTPRISPVEAHLVDGRLMLVMIAGSRKAGDVARDPRVVLQSPVTDAEDPGTELKLRGRAVEVDDAERTATAQAVEAASGWRPRESWRFMSLEIESVALLEWIEGDMLLSRWDRDSGLRATERRRLDLDESRYRRGEQ
jgi:pyridoxamine 5'-phosphate oxidase-like protein